MAEPLYLFHSLLAFHLVARIWAEDDASVWAGAGLLTGLAALLRPNGAVLPLALGATLWLARRRRISIVALSCGLLPAGLFYFWSRMLTGTGSGYSEEMADPLSTGHPLTVALRLIAANLPFYARELLARVCFRWPLLAGENAAEFMIAAAVGAAALNGAYRVRKDAWRALPWMHAALYIASLLLWYKQSNRYLLPILPFLTLALLKGLEDWNAMARIRWNWAWTAVAIGRIPSSPGRIRT
jgi:hypothetical protein